jgi:hypothetical protein
MHLQLRTWVITAMAVGCALVIGVGLADEKYFLTSVMVALTLWLFAEWWGGPRPEAWMLGAVLFGYLVGNRGFAQFSLSSRLPLLPAEAALLVGVPAILFRAGFKHVAFLRRDALNLAILVWMIVAAARLPIDWQRDRFVALRDFATVYYASFFFLAQTLGMHAASLKLLRGSLTAAALVLPPRTGFLHQHHNGARRSAHLSQERPDRDFARGQHVLALDALGGNPPQGLADPRRDFDSGDCADALAARRDGRDGVRHADLVDGAPPPDRRATTQRGADRRGRLARRDALQGQLSRHAHLLGL